MISLITAGIISCVTGLTIAKYKHVLNQQSQKETIVIIKNASELVLQEQGEQITVENTENQKISGRHWLFIPIPLPKISEIRGFVIFSSVLPFFGVLSFGLLLLIEGKVSLYLQESFYYTLGCITLFITFKAISYSYPGYATLLKYVVILTSFVLSLYIFIEPNFRLFTSSNDDYILRIIILSSITSLAFIIADPIHKRNEQEY